jgi:hypothetical protein
LARQAYSHRHILLGPPGKGDDWRKKNFQESEDRDTRNKSNAAAAAAKAAASSAKASDATAKAKLATDALPSKVR